MLDPDAGDHGAAAVRHARKDEGYEAMIESVGIIGAGTMGNGIAQVCAAAGLQS